MTGLRTYSPMKRSRGTVIPDDVRAQVKARDRYCVCDRADFPTDVQERCGGTLELDHVHGAGLSNKGDSIPSNLVVLSAWCHRWKTDHGKTARPLLDRYLERVEDPHDAHVDPCPECPKRRSASEEIHDALRTALEETR